MATIYEYDLQSIPEYRRPLAEVLIAGGDLWVDGDGYDTPENIDKLACDILNVVQANNMLAQHTSS